MTPLVLYYREQCHLCDAMRRALVVFKRKHNEIEWKEIDIDRDIDLVRDHGHNVPVLCLDGEEVCHYFFDEPALLRRLSLPTG